ncbi:MAG TPA: dynamin family protein [Stellaceae bacterium]|nr:dynamin family protein [Stellaceae bacterium]
MAVPQSDPAQPARDGRTSDRLLSLLVSASDCLAGVWPAGRLLSQRLDELAGRLSAGRLRVAVLGQFKRGKSTFLNALLGCDLLPSGVVPLTAIPTFLRWGPDNQAEVSYLDGRLPEKVVAADPRDIAALLRRYVTEEGNPRNRAGVARVEVSLPAAMLASGIELIDTPGIGSTLRHNTDAALQVLPECDAAFFVVSVDPPITAAELDYLDRARAGISPILFILNKVDYLPAAERRSAADFLRQALRDHSASLAAPVIFELSARNALRAKHEQDKAAVESSGLAAIEAHLAVTMLHAKRDILRTAITQKAATILDLARSDAALAVRALEMPIEELAARARRFGEAVADIERQRLLAADLLGGDRRRMRQSVEQRAELLRSEARTSLLALADAAFSDMRPAAKAEEAAKSLIAEAIPGLFQAALERAARQIADELDENLAGHVDRAETVIAAVRKSAAELFDIPCPTRETTESFVTARAPYWVTQKWHETLLPLSGGVIDRFLPAIAARTRAKRRLSAEVDDLVARNVENLRWATLQNVDDAFRRFSRWFDERLGEAIEATRGAIAAAQESRRLRAGEAEADLQRLRSTQEQIAALLDRLNVLQQREKQRVEPELALAAGDEGDG